MRKGSLVYNLGTLKEKLTLQGSFTLVCINIYQGGVRIVSLGLIEHTLHVRRLIKVHRLNEISLQERKTVCFLDIIHQDTEESWTFCENMQGWGK